MYTLIRGKGITKWNGKSVEFDREEMFMILH
jgi:hypothetical protein